VREESVESTLLDSSFRGEKEGKRGEEGG